jgi:hypothetical protein
MKMQDEQYQRIKEAAWRRPLTREEEASLQMFLSADPAAREAWIEEAALNRLLERLPAPPVSTNFTARLMKSVRSAPVRRDWRDWFAPSQWLPEGLAGRLAMCSMMLCLGVISFHEYQSIHRARVARALAGVSRVAQLPRIEWLKDFDTINGISQVKVADDELLAALQ